MCSQNNGKVYGRNIIFLRPRDVDSEGNERTKVPVQDPLAQPPSHSDRNATPSRSEPEVTSHISGSISNT